MNFRYLNKLIDISLIIYKIILSTENIIKNIEHCKKLNTVNNIQWNNEMKRIIREVLFKQTIIVFTKQFLFIIYSSHWNMKIDLHGTYIVGILRSMKNVKSSVHDINN